MPSQIKMLENIQPSQMEIPSELLLKWSIMYMFYISRNLLRFFSMEIPSQLLLKWSICSTSVEIFSDSSQYRQLLNSFSNGGYPYDLVNIDLYVL